MYVLSKVQIFNLTGLKDEIFKGRERGEGNYSKKARGASTPGRRLIEGQLLQFV